MSVGQICVRQLDIISPLDSIRTAAARLRDHMVGSLIVAEPVGAPMGILTDRDIAVRVVAAGLDPDETNVQEVMTKAPRVVREDTPIEAALEQMRAGPHRRLPVVDDKGELVGVISLDDILDLLAEEFNLIGELLRRENPTKLSAV
ncbi:MAG: CBS domain-containing protein [Planctomycetales bacterium]|nr:CBS domain-containing protein [Planctomycetales bacterium]